MIRIILVIASFFTALFSIVVLADESLMFSRCQVEKESRLLDAQCAILKRPENPGKPDGKTVDLFVTKFPAAKSGSSNDAFTIIQGGPGMSSIDLYFDMQAVLRGIRQNRDILIVDQRGTGRSNMLTCDEMADQTYKEFNLDLTRKFTKKCLENLDSDVRFYTTSVAVNDLEAVRKASGYEELSIYGVSYGTRVAQHYMRRFPQRVRAVILDGAIHPQLNLSGGEVARRSQQAFDNMSSRCAASDACKEQFGDINKKFVELRERLKKSAVNVKLPHPDSGVFVTKQLTEQHLLAIVRLMPYSTESLALLPMMLSQAHNNDFILMASQATMIEAFFSKYYAFAMNNAVLCTEDAPFIKEQGLVGEEDTYFGTDMTRSIEAVCDQWPAGVMDEDFKTSFSNDIPVLILSGELDPITPPENGDKVHAMLNNSRHLVIPSHGHGVIARGCVPQLATEFIKKAKFEDLNSECINRERAFPFFINTTGPKP